MEKRIIRIGFVLPGRSDPPHSYSTNQSLLDADIVIFETDFGDYDLEPLGEHFQGKPCYNRDSSFQLQEDTQHWRKELSTTLEAGKTVFVFFKKFQEIYVHSGNTQYSGPGRNARATNTVSGYHNYHFFPVEIPTIVPKVGKEIVFGGHPVFSSLWSEFKDYMGYESYLDGKVTNPLFLTKTGGKVVGALFRVGKGNLVLLPPLEYDEKKFVKYDPKKKQAFWTKDAQKFGHRLLKIFVDIDNALRKGGDKTPPPDWITEDIFELLGGNRIKTEIESKSKQIDALVVEKNGLLAQLDLEVQLQDLLFEKGKILENAIIYALEILGYKAENYNNGDLEFDQVIISPDGDRFIGEAEGKDSSAVNIDKFRQLTANIQEDLQREEISSPAIGILFGNGFRLTKPSDRTEQFTVKCLNVAKSSNCVLVRTSDLFRAAKYVKESKNDSFAKNCRDAIKNGVGKIADFPVIQTP